MKNFFRDLPIKLLFWLLLGLILYASFYAVKMLFFPLLIGVLGTMLLSPAVELFERMGMSRVGGIFVVFGLFFMFVASILALLVPKVYEEVYSFNQNKQYYMKEVQKYYTNIKGSVEKRYKGVIPWKEIEAQYNAPRALSKKWLLKLPKFVGNSLELLLSFLIIPPLFAFFMLKDGAALKKYLIQFVPNRYFELVMELLHNVNQQIVAFIRGQMMDSLINAFMYATVLSMIGLPYAIIVGIFGGIANAVPVIGPTVTALIALLIALLTQSTSVWLVLLVVGIVHLIDVSLVYPRMVGHSLQIHEMIVIIGVLVGGHLGGIVGMFLVVPLLGIVFRSTNIVYKTLKGYQIL
ncbi:MAG: hypothetical protein CL920_25530 [Deltaproteobacteria bacterium]|nr:hypothetical protein [Deltaproteobacteria bacterium]MBU52069.1 hypothetical protein [Deltaproteobacteria bacterium]|tara:strand:- start:1326 stop:2375 length:1050 start_codon:yes stop_codon:yes gene_type:complete